MLVATVMATAAMMMVPAATTAILVLNQHLLRRRLQRQPRRQSRHQLRRLVQHQYQLPLLQRPSSICKATMLSKAQTGAATTLSALRESSAILVMRARRAAFASITQ